MSWVTDPTQLSIRSQVTELDSGNTPRTSDILAFSAIFMHFLVGCSRSSRIQGDAVYCKGKA